jgi:hypothetical protein
VPTSPPDFLHTRNRAFLRKLTHFQAESVIAKYSLERLTGDHELYKHIGRVNKVINDEKEAERKSEEDAKIQPVMTWEI